MEKNYSKIYADNPLDKAEQFDFKAYSKTLTDIILYKENETPITIGIHGEWGSGKTTLMKTIKETLEKPSEDKNFRKCKCVWFNAWKYADEESILTALVNKIIEQIEKDEKGLLKKLNEFKENYKNIKSVNLSVLGQGGGIELRDDKSRLNYDEFQKTLNDVLEKYITGSSNDDGILDDRKGVLVIFIDDLDRCPPDKVLKVIETIKLFMDQKGCVFVLGADMKVVSNVVEKAYKETKGFDGKQFMEKIVQLPFNLPPIRGVDIEEFIKSLGVKGMIKDYIKIISKGIKSNPRRIKRFLNLFELQRNLAENKGILGEGKELEEELLTKWCILEFEFPDFMDEVKRRYELLILVQKVAREKLDEIEKLEKRDRELYEKFYNGRIITVLEHGEKEFTEENIENYIYQAQEVGLESKEETKRLTREEIIEKVRKGESLNYLNLNGVNLNGVNLNGVNLRWTKLEGANLRDTDLCGANLTNADLEGADLYDAHLYGANLIGAKLGGADLRGADLRGADLREVILEGANLHGANLHGANLEVATFTNAKIDLKTINLKNTNWQDAFWNEETRKKLEQKYGKK